MVKTLRYFMFIIIMLLWHVDVLSQEKSKVVLDYIEKYKNIAMREMQVYKIPASITLAQGLLESGNGNSELAKKSNNHFGIKCHNTWKGKRTYHDDDAKGECFRVYDSPADSYRDHSKFLANGQRYAFLFDLQITDYKGWAKGLKKAGYATLPVYANVLIKLIEDYDLVQYDQMVVKGKFKNEEKKVVPKKEDGQKKTSNTNKNTQSGGNNSSNKTDVNKNKSNNKTEKVAGTYTPNKLTDAKVVGKAYDGRYVRENNGVKFIYAKAGDNVHKLANDLEMYEYQLVKYNNLGKRRTFKENEIIYIEPKKNKASRKYKYHTIQKGETLSYVSRLYGVKLESIYKMNGMDANTILYVGDNIKLR
ncbi:MAG: glucosaminidase domain-containing protein [Bacteroidales bacterium]|nr:glucosaminidase domain-containing protein [Bacteroidales bacterium]